MQISKKLCGFHGRPVFGATVIIAQLETAIQVSRPLHHLRNVVNAARAFGAIPIVLNNEETASLFFSPQSCWGEHGTVWRGQNPLLGLQAQAFRSVDDQLSIAGSVTLIITEIGLWNLIG